MLNSFIQSPLRLAALAFAVRLLFLLLFAGPNYFEGLSKGYLDVAENVYSGRGVVTYVDVAPLASNEHRWEYVPYIDRPLGYLFLILLPYYLGSSIGIQLLHALLAAVSTVLLFTVGRKIVSETVAARAAIVYAIWPLSARFEIAVLPDAVMSFFLLVTVWCFLNALTSEQKTRWLVLTGLACGVGMTMRPDILLLPLFIIVAMALFKVSTTWLRDSALILAGVGIIVGAHTMRNYSATEGKLAPLGLGNGISMWEGISQFGDTLGTVFGDERTATLEGYRQWGYPHGVERDRERFREAVNIMLNNPGFSVVLMLKRIPVLLTPDWIMTNKFYPSLKSFLGESQDRTMFQYIQSYPGSSALRILLVLLQYSSLALVCVALVKKPVGQFLWIPALLIMYYIVIHIPTNTEARYFYPVVPFTLLLASAGWERIRYRTVNPEVLS